MMGDERSKTMWCETLSKQILYDTIDNVYNDTMFVLLCVVS